MFRILSRVLIVGGIAVAPGQALAFSSTDWPTEVHHKTVFVGDLNLERQAGAEVYLNRVSQAARAVCGPAPIIRDLNASQVHRVCIAAAKNDAVSQASSPLVAQLYFGRTREEVAELNYGY